MTDHDIHGCGRAGSAIGVLCAFLGMVCAFMIFFGLIQGTLPRDVVPTIVVAAISVLVWAGFWGKKAGVFLCEKGNQSSTNIWIGIALAFGSIASAILTGALVGPLFSGNIVGVPNALALSLIIGIYAAFWGGIPATILGVLYGVLMTGQLRALNR